MFLCRLARAQVLQEAERVTIAEIDDSAMEQEYDEGRGWSLLTAPGDGGGDGGGDGLQLMIQPPAPGAASSVCTATPVQTADEVLDELLNAVLPTGNN